MKNCSGLHKSNDKKCKAYSKEVEILKYKESRQISYLHAKSICESTSKEINEDAIDKSRKDEIQKLREDFKKMSIELRSTRENELRLTVENAQLHEVIPSLRGEITNLKAKISSIKCEHHEEIKNLFDENKVSLNELSEQNIEYANQIENAKARIMEAEEKYLETKKNLDESTSRLDEFVTSSQTIRKAYQTFYTRMSKAGNPAYPPHKRPTSE